MNPVGTSVLFTWNLFYNQILIYIHYLLAPDHTKNLSWEYDQYLNKINYHFENSSLFLEKCHYQSQGLNCW